MDDYDDEDEGHAAIDQDIDDRQADLELRRERPAPGRDGPLRPGRATIEDRRTLELECQRCHATYMLGAAAIDVREASNRFLGRRGEAIDDLCEVCRVDSARHQARLSDDRRQAALRARTRLLASVRPTAVEVSDWQLVEQELGEVQARAMKAARVKPKTGAM